MFDSIIPFFIAHTLLGYSLAYLDPASRLRLLVLGLIIICCLISVQCSVARRIPGMVGHEYIIGFVLHASYLLV